MPLSQRFMLPLLAAGALALSAPLSAEEVIATVNGSKITTTDYQRFVFEATQGKGGKLNPKEVLAELLSRELAYQDAMKKGMDKRKDVQAELERLKHKLLVGVALEETIKKNPVTDKDIKAYYDNNIKNLKLKEYKARHIMVKDKAKAEQLITELDLGGDFSALATKHSIDTESQKKGGALGWFQPQKQPIPFSQAVSLLEKGKYTKAPIKTQFGWHIIKLEDSRPLSPPTLEQIKPKLSQVVQQKKVNEYIQALKDKADIKIIQPKQ